MDLHGIREDYSKRQLSEEDCAADPLVQFEQWLNEAMTAQVNEPTAVNVAAVGTDGRPNSRMVLLKEVNPRGFVFFTNYQSRKGQSLAAHPFAALTFFWPELERQVRVEGRVENWMPPRPTNISPAVPIPAASGRGERAEQRDCRQKRAGQTRCRHWFEASAERAAPAALGRLHRYPRPRRILAGGRAGCTTASDTGFQTAFG